MERLVSVLGIFVLLGLCVGLSRNRRAISWRLVAMGLLIQLVLGGLFLYWDTGNRVLRDVGHRVKEFLDLAQRGTEFIWGDLGRSSSDRDLYLFESADRRRFDRVMPFVAGASAASVASTTDGGQVVVFRWPAPDLPHGIQEIGRRSRSADGSWDAPVPVRIDGLPPDLGAPFDPCLVALDDSEGRGDWRLYFSAARDGEPGSALWSARSSDAVTFSFEPGARFAVPGEVIAHGAVARWRGAWTLVAPVRGQPGKAHTAVSIDGLTFGPGTAIDLDGAGAWHGSLVVDGESLCFYGPGWNARDDGDGWRIEAPAAVFDGQHRHLAVDPGVGPTGDGAIMIAPGRPGFGFVFAAQILPTLIFFSAFMGVLYHLGIMQWVVRAMAVVMARLLGTSGAESLSACGNVFVGQTEAPLMVRPFLPRMTTSELHAVMTGGFATIAGGVFALYVGFGVDPGHLIVASVMAVPAGLVCSKILWPETETSETFGRVELNAEKRAGNVVEAAANGALDGLKLALNVGAMLVAFLGLVAVADWLLGGVGLSVGQLLGWTFSPIAAVMGVPWEEVPILGRLLGTKIAVTELIAYSELGQLKAAGALSDRGILIASFALCGFANFGSMAIQIGGLGAMAPERKADLSRIAWRAMFAGAIATCVTASMAGALSDV